MTIAAAAAAHADRFATWGQSGGVYLSPSVCALLASDLRDLAERIAALEALPVPMEVRPAPDRAVPPGVVDLVPLLSLQRSIRAMQRETAL